VAVDRLGVVRGFLKAGPSRGEDAPAGTGEVYAVYVDPTAWAMADNDQARHLCERFGFVPDGFIRGESIGDREVTEVRLIRCQADQTSPTPASAARPARSDGTSLPVGLLRGHSR
jgi:hypothetical protein